MSLQRSPSASGRVAELQVELDPNLAGFNARRLERVDRHVAHLIDSGQLPGALVVISRGGKIIHLVQQGQRDAEAGLPVESDTIWRIYSMTKPIVSVAALMLYEQAAFELWDPIARFLPEFGNMRVFRRLAGGALESAPAGEYITICNLMTHTAGVTYSFLFRDPVDAAYRAGGFAPFAVPADPLATVCERLAAFPLLFEPGTEWNYSMATDVLGRLVEVVSGRPLDEFLEQRILRPLGMRDTAFWAPPQAQQRLATLSTPDAQTCRLVRSPLDAAARSQPVCFSGGGGLVSTAADYHRFARMLLNGGELDGVRLLGPRTVQLMTRNHLPGGADLTTFGRPLGDLLRPGYGFGLGVQVLVDPVRARSLSAVGEYGWGGAAGTNFWIDPSHELIVMFFSQLMPQLSALRHQLRQLVYQALVA